MSVERFHYTLATTGFSNGFQAQLAPLLEESLADRAALNAESRDALSFQRQAFPKLGQLADQIILDADFPVEEKNAILVAHELESYLRDSTRFTYSLDLNEVRRQRNPESDPVEDFVTNHRTGHCEYFASALALMLRSQGIPSRVVVGYRASEFNAYGQYFRVRQRDAHAWVEAFLTPEQIPDDMPEKALPNFRGAWLRLDPTPSASSRRSAAVQRGLVDEIYDTLDYAQMLWGSYVMGMNPEQQRTSIYEPLADSTAEAILNPLGMRDAAFGWLASLLGLKAEDRENWQWRTWFSWRAALAAVVLCLTLLALLRVLQKLSRSLLVRLRRRRRKLRSRKVVRVEFYEKLERLLARLGLHRRSTQTQREFAIEATGLLADSVGLRTGARLPRQIAQAFYVVRFGGRQLDSSELADVEQALQSLESLIAHRSASSTAK